MLIGGNPRLSRRQVVVLVGGAALAWPGIGVAEVATRRPIVAILQSRSPEATRRYTAAFTQSMQEFGFVAGQNYEIVLRSTDGDATRGPGLLAELIALDPAMILTIDTTQTLAAKRATQTIPITPRRAMPTICGRWLRPPAAPSRMRASR